MKIEIHQVNPIVGDIEYNFNKILSCVKDSNKKNVDLAVFGELTLVGYPAEDLILNKSFIKRVAEFLDKLILFSKKVRTPFLIGLPIEIQSKVYNAAVLIHNGRILARHFKNKLPSYSLFDEHRVFNKGKEIEILNFQNQKICLLICEDLWHEEIINEVKKNSIDLLITLNASPYRTNIHKKRFDLAERIPRNGISLIYANIVGGQEDVVFDGRSFVLDKAGKILSELDFAEEDSKVVNLSNQVKTNGDSYQSYKMPFYEEIYRILIKSLRDFIHKQNFKSVILGLSGGIDSALVATLAVDALGPNNIYSIMLPSKYTSLDSLNDARTLAKNLGINYKEISIQKIFDNFLNEISEDFSEDLIANQNLQSRIRANILMYHSNKDSHILLSTGNKSELATGYATIYGDMCGGFNPIKDCYKTQVFELAKYRNLNIPSNSIFCRKNIIPKNIISKLPSAELATNQKDTDSLPNYNILDKILLNLVENDLHPSEIKLKKINFKLIKRVYDLLNNSEFKRHQSTPGTIITDKSFSRCRRYPIISGYYKLKI